MEAFLVDDRQQWNDFLVTLPNCNITQSYEWGELALHAGAKEVFYVGVKDEHGCLCAVALVFLTYMPQVRGYYLYSPRGPMIRDPDSPAMDTLLDYVHALARERRCFMFKIEPGAQEDDQAWRLALKRRDFRVNPHPMHVRHEWVLDIRPDEQTLLANMKEKWRYNIRLATRRGVTIREGTGEDDVATFYAIYQVTSARDRFFIHDQAHYEKVLRLYRPQNRVKLLLAEYEGQAIAGTLTLTLGHWSWYMFGASANEHRERMPNHLLQWTAIRWAKEQGCQFYNFRGIPEELREGSEQWGVYQFKRGFGGFPLMALETHDYVYQPLVYQVYRGLLGAKHWLRENAGKK